MNRTIRKIWNVVTTVIVVLIMILALLFVGARIFGLHVFSVISGSMEPMYPVGSLIYVKEVDPMELQVRDVITFMLNEDIVATHRIVEVIPDENDSDVVRFRTKGDANAVEDSSLVHCKNVIGTPVFTIPLLGYVANYIHQPPGLYITISVGAILLILFFIPEILSDDKVKKKQDSALDNGGDPDTDGKPIL